MKYEAQYTETLYEIINILMLEVAKMVMTLLMMMTRMMKLIFMVVNV